MQEKIKLKKQVAEIVHNTSSSSLFLVSLFGNPIISVAGWAGFKLLENSSFLEATSESLASWWLELSPTTKKTIIFGASATTALSVVLLASMLFNKPSGRGGITILPKLTKFVGSGIEAEVVPEFCQILWEYSKNNPFPSTFRTPQREMSSTLLRQLIYLLNQKMIRKDQINFAAFSSLYELLVLCGKQGG